MSVRGIIVKSTRIAGIGEGGTPPAFTESLLESQKKRERIFSIPYYRLKVNERSRRREVVSSHE